MLICSLIQPTWCVNRFAILFSFKFTYRKEDHSKAFVHTCFEEISLGRSNSFITEGFWIPHRLKRLIKHHSTPNKLFVINSLHKQIHSWSVYETVDQCDAGSIPRSALVTWRGPALQGMSGWARSPLWDEGLGLCKEAPWRPRRWVLFVLKTSVAKMCNQWIVPSLPTAAGFIWSVEQHHVCDFMSPLLSR